MYSEIFLKQYHLNASDDKKNESIQTEEVK